MRTSERSPLWVFSFVLIAERASGPVGSDIRPGYDNFVRSPCGQPFDPVDAAVYLESARTKVSAAIKT